MSETPATAERTSGLVYGAAFALVFVGATTLFLGLLDDSVRTIITSLLASLGALLLLATGVARSSGPPKADRQS